MAIVKLVVTSLDAAGSVGQFYGYPAEVREDKEVWADIPDDLIQGEIDAGRVDEHSVQKVKKIKVDKAVDPASVSKELINKVESAKLT